jgi:cell wall-associated NlpC family hydrolase
VRRCSALHEGADINAPEGMPVHAAAAGRIVQRGRVDGYGNYVCIRHAATFATCYAHLSRYGAYQMGATVDQDAVIGYAGHTGVGTGPHLHFEVRLSAGAGDPAVDPLPFLTGAVSPTADVDATAEMASGGCSDDASGIPATDAPIAPGPTAELHAKTLSAPASAPAAVRKMIAAGNAIQSLPYSWGGGHNATFTPTPGFDCSAAVSFVLHRAGLLDRPLTSGELERYGQPGPGTWVTIYAHAGHAFIYVAGQRLDTSAAGSTVNAERGPRWRGPGARATAGFTVVHPPGL